MKTFLCTKCNESVRRPTVPLKCQACGAQGFGVFREQGAVSGSPTAKTVPRPGGAVQPPPPPPGVKPPPMPPGGSSPARPQQPPMAGSGGQAPAAPAPSATPAQPPAPSAQPADAGKQAGAGPVKATPPPPPGKLAASATTRGEQAASPTVPSTPPSKPEFTPQQRTQDPPAKPSQPSKTISPPELVETNPPAPVPQKTSPEPPAAEPEWTVREETAAAKPTPTKEATSPQPAQPAATSPASTTPGAVLWQYPTIVPGHDQPYPPIRNGVVVDGDGRMYSALGASLLALEDADGKPQVVWEFKTSGVIPGPPVMGPDGRFRVHSGDGKLYCVSPSGELVFAAEVDQPLGWAAPVVDRTNTTWICRYGGGLTSVDAQGNVRATPFFRSRQKFDSTGLIAEDTFYVGSEDGFVFAIRTNESRGRNVFDHNRGRGKTDWFINSAPALTADEQLIVAGRDGFVYSFDLNGMQNWKLAVPGQMLASPVAAPSGRIFVATSMVQAGQPSRGQLLAIDPAGPRVAWEYSTKRQIEATAVIGDDGTIYFGDNAGEIHAVDSHGKKLWKTEVGAAVRSAGTIYAPGRLLFGLDNGSLVAVVCASQGIAVGGWPKYMGNRYNCMEHKE